MTQKQISRVGDSGSALLVVVLFLAVAIAAFAAVSSARVVSETGSQKVLEDGSRALNSAYAQIHLAMSVVNNSAYDELNHNLELRAAVSGDNGGTVENAAAVDPPAESNGEATGYGTATWLDHTEDPAYGFIVATGVRVYHAREYIERLQRLRGESMTEVDPTGVSDSYFVLEAAGRSGETIRVVSALVRENEPFSSFVFFQNRGTLGVSGAPRGLIHANEDIDFYFPNGVYVDPISAVNGFGYAAGATAENTGLRRANPSAARINLQEVNFEVLKTKADLFVGGDGLDAEIQFQNNGQIHIKEHTPPRFEMVTKSRTDQILVGFHTETYMDQEKVKIGEQEITWDEEVIDHYVSEDYLAIEQVQVGEVIETRTRDVQVEVGTQEVVKTRTEPIYEWQTTTEYRSVLVWVPYETNAGGGTTVGGGGDGSLGEYEWIEEPYEVDVQVQIGVEVIEYTVTEPVYETVTETYDVTVPVYEDQEVTRTRDVPVYVTVTKTRMEDIFEWQDVEKEMTVNDYESVTVTWEEEAWIAPTLVASHFIDLPADDGGTLYVDGRITSLSGDLKGRLTIVGNEKVRITGNIRYVDDKGATKMLHGTDYIDPYVRNPEYTGDDILGVIAREDVLFTHTIPGKAEVNGTLMSVNGRVGIDGFWADESGELHGDSESARSAYLTPEQQETERAYDRHGSYNTKLFIRESLRRIGGIVSNNRIMETYVSSQDGYSKVSAGFKRGSMLFDISVLVNPPPNFVS
ncbi:MAG: hypothetical protein ACYSUN_06050, partial [Planctomycetota bacterium]